MNTKDISNPKNPKRVMTPRAPKVKKSQENTLAMNENNNTPWLLQLEFRLVFGRKLFYPRNANARILVKITRSGSFILSDVQALKDMGFKIEIVMEDPNQFLK